MDGDTSIDVFLVSASKKERDGERVREWSGSREETESRQTPLYRCVQFRVVRASSRAERKEWTVRAGFEPV